MATTIQVCETTLQQLKELKKEMEMETYDMLIKELIMCKRKTPQSMFGAHPNIAKFRPRDEGEFHEL